jgi:cell wall-associated NlpC family hydrolase
MRIWPHIAVALLFAVFAGVGGARGQEADSSPSSSVALGNASSAQNNKKAKAENENHQSENNARQSNPRSLSRDDRSALMSVALDDRHIRMGPRRDCSHLIHAIYLRAGLPYAYVPSSDIYEGADPFQRVKRPQPGDLIVWRGHVGMVVDPREHLFYSFTSSEGPATDDYKSPYWKSRGKPRFYRYVKGVACSACYSAGPSFRRTRDDK